MLRVAATIRSGHVPASALVSRLQSSTRQNDLAAAIKDYGKLAKTISSLRYFHDETHRRKVGAQLNKSEGIHALRREIVHANDKLTGRTVDDQDLHAECVTIITNAIIYWNTIYTAQALHHISQTETVKDLHLARLAATGSNHINMIGRFNFTDPQTPETGTDRPLRTSDDTQP